MILYSMILSFASQAARISAPFLPHFCVMIRNSSFTTERTVKSGKQKVKFLTLYQRLTSTLAQTGKEKVKFWGSINDLRQPSSFRSFNSSNTGLPVPCPMRFPLAACRFSLSGARAQSRCKKVQNVTDLSHSELSMR